MDVREPLRVVVDERETPSGLPGAIARLHDPTLVGRLPVGDVEVGPRVVVERKTVTDFVASLRDDRLFRQAKALNQICGRPLLVVEGEDDFTAMGLPPESLRGVLLALLVGYRIPLLRTASVDETALTIARVAAQERRRLTPGPLPPAEPARRALGILASIPGVGDDRARRLLTAFGSVRAVATATEQSLAAVPGIGPGTAAAIHRACGPPSD